MSSATPQLFLRCLPGGLLAAALLAAQCPVRAEPQLYVDDVAPLAWHDGPVIRGVLYELMRDMAARAGHSGKIASVPLKRELALTAASPQTLSTLARFPEDEQSYTWLCKLLEERIVLVANGDSTFDLGSLDAVRDLRVGVILGGSAEALARRLGFRNIQPTGGAESTARKLTLGRIDAWLVAAGIAAHQQENLGGATLSWRSGPTLQPISIYLAAARNADPAMLATWRAACDAMQKDGSYVRILHQYHYEPPK